MGIRSPASRHTSSCDRQVASEQCVQAIHVTDGACLAVERQQVVIDPETKAHVWVHEQVQDCTTRYTSVFVNVTLAVCNLNNSTHWVYDHALDAVRCTARNVDEHVDEKNKCTRCVLDDAMTGQGLEPCAPRWMSAVP